MSEENRQTPNAYFLTLTINDESYKQISKKYKLKDNNDIATKYFIYQKYADPQKASVDDWSLRSRSTGAPVVKFSHCKWPRVFKPAKTCNEEGHTTDQNQEQKDQQTE